MATGNNQPHDVPQAPTQTSRTTQRMSVPVRKCHLSSQPPQTIPTAPPTHTHHTLQRIFFSIDRLFYGTHSRTTYNHSRIVNHFAMLSRATANHINFPQQKTFTYHSPLPFLNLQIVCTPIPDCVTSHATIFLQPLDRPPRSGFFPVGESLNIINSIQKP